MQGPDIWLEIFRLFRLIESVLQGGKSLYILVYLISFILDFNKNVGIKMSLLKKKKTKTKQPQKKVHLV